MAATNGTRKGTPANARNASANSNSVLPSSVYDKLLSAEDKKPVKVVVRRKAQAAQSEPGNWQDSKAIKPKARLPNAQSRAQAVADGANPPTTLVNGVDSRIANTFPSGRPFEETAEMVQCRHCKKPVFKMAAPQHIRDCLRKKQEKLQKKKEAKEAKDAALRKERNGGISPEPVDDKGSVTGKPGVGETNGIGGAKKTSKKRKADDDGKGPSAKKKKKDEQKPKAAKPKGPVDVERQCGVPLANGSMCARSLTCKSHSMGAKRAVPGRSMPYDVLLANYQKKNQAKLQRAAMDANAPLADDFEPQGTVDSDEERDAIMAGINRYYRTDMITGERTMGEPLVTWNPVPVRRRYNYIRLKGAIQQAIGGVHGSKLFATPATMHSGMFGSFGGESATADTFDSARRPSSVAPSRQGTGPSRKPSISSTH